MKFLLDSNTCIEHLRHGGNSTVATRLAACMPGDVVLCSVVVGELRFGALRSRDVAKNLVEVRNFCQGFLSIPFDDAAAGEYATLRADLAARGLPIGSNDMLIAAIALANGLTLVTHNTAEFGRIVGLTMEDWQI